MCHCKPIKKWIVIPIWSAPSGVSNIEWKLPANVEKVIGVAFTITDFNGVFPVSKIGEINLLANERLSHPLNFDVYNKPKLRRVDKEELELSEPIRSGTRVEGYYRNCTDIEHQVNLYLHCILKHE